MELLRFYFHQFENFQYRVHHEVPRSIVLDNLYKANPANVSIVDDNKNADLQSEEEIISEAEDTLTSLYKYVDQLNTNVDKSKLNQLFANLYTEAQNLEV